jgi:hypothetical protein
LAEEIDRPQKLGADRRGIELSPDQRNSEALRNLIGESVTRDATDYAAVERRVKEKIAPVVPQGTSDPLPTSRTSFSSRGPQGPSV